LLFLARNVIQFLKNLCFSFLDGKNKLWNA
jgi:hypothetical protein